MLSLMVKEQLTQAITEKLTQDKELIQLSHNKAFKSLLGFILALSSTNTALAFDKKTDERLRLGALDKVALCDEILTYILKYKGEENE